ncbi:MAG: hypothetical protein K6F72_09680 [Bacteroidales bacterium]|nr:hypothetical protein [Bacteroidales bacterium]
MSKQKPLTSYKRNFILRNYKEMTIGDIAKRLRVPYNMVYNVLYARGLLDVKKQEPFDLERGVASRILWMYIQGWYLEDIMEATHKSEGICIRVIGKVFPSAALHRRSTMFEEPKDSYTGMTEYQMRMQRGGAA